MDGFPMRDDGFAALDDAGIGATDAALLEDEPQNQRQAARNRRIRDLMAARKKKTAGAPKAQGAFGELEKIVDTTSAALNAPPPWFAIRDEASVNLRLHEELLDFVAFVRASDAEMEARRSWVNAIGEAARSIWSGSQVQLFGSSSTGLCLPTADVDVTVTGLDADVRPTTALKLLAERLLERGEVSKIEIIQSAKVPVMKLQQQSTGLMADVIINRVDGLATSKFIREQIEVFPALVPLVLFLKLYLLQRGLSETFQGGMGSYLLVCVVLAFLQQHPSSKDPQLFATTTLANLLFDFFRYYGQEFRYGIQGISVLNGGSLFNREARGWNAKDRNGRPTLCLESPLETSVDIGSRCFKIGVIRAAFNHGYHVLGSYFINKEAPGKSLLCPSLLRPDHPMLTGRHQLLKPQPPPLLAEAQGVDESDDEDDNGLDGPPKRRRLLESATGEAGAKGAADTLDQGSVAAAPEVEAEDDDDEVIDVVAAPASAGAASDPAVDAPGDAFAEGFAEDFGAATADAYGDANAEAEFEAPGEAAADESAADPGFVEELPGMEAFDEGADLGDFGAPADEVVATEEAVATDEVAEESEAPAQSGGGFGDDFIAF
eukprot:TRINITY_DN13857_c0_g1_i1.p1 TRINITY_DN13857_c0_g1~~TRINITY_DN13857_c0_g1_i1.p1  ORF type:complete len:604 (+),score=155.99 TRINITY_DN13857_c0_g1_i1:40-1851(+)